MKVGDIILENVDMDLEKIIFWRCFVLISLSTVVLFLIGFYFFRFWKKTKKNQKILSPFEKASQKLELLSSQEESSALGLEIFVIFRTFLEESLKESFLCKTHAELRECIKRSEKLSEDSSEVITEYLNDIEEILYSPFIEKEHRDSIHRTTQTLFLLEEQIMKEETK